MLHHSSSRFGILNAQNSLDFPAKSLSRLTKAENVDTQQPIKWSDFPSTAKSTCGLFPSCLANFTCKTQTLWLRTCYFSFYMLLFVLPFARMWDCWVWFVCQLVHPSVTNKHCNLNQILPILSPWEFRIWHKHTIWSTPNQTDAPPLPFPQHTQMIPIEKYNSQNLLLLFLNFLLQ